MPRGLWSDYDPETNTFVVQDPIRGAVRVTPDGSLFSGTRTVGNDTIVYVDGVVRRIERPPAGRAPSQAVPAAEVRAGAAEDVANIRAEADKWIAQLTADIAKTKLEQDKAHDAAMEALDAGKLEESKRQFDLSHALSQRIADLNDNKFAWQQKVETATLGFQEHRNRIEEAQVTGYYRPSASTPFSRPASPIAMAAAAPTLRREMTAGSGTPPPYGGGPAAPQIPPPAISATQPPAARDTKDLNLDELGQVFGKQAQGDTSSPAARTTSVSGAQGGPTGAFTPMPSPGPFTNMQQQEQQKVRKRTVTEEFV